MNVEQKQFNALVQRLDAILKLLALGLPEGLTSQEKIVKLSDTGLKGTEIAQILGTSPGYVAVALDRARKRSKAKPKDATSPPVGGG